MPKRSGLWFSTLVSPSLCAFSLPVSCFASSSNLLLFAMELIEVLCYLMVIIALNGNSLRYLIRILLFAVFPGFLQASYKKGHRDSCLGNSPFSVFGCALIVALSNV